MSAYLLKRVLLGAVSLFGLSVFVFVMMRMLPGDPALMIAGEEAATDPELLAAIRSEYLLDRPIYEQYGVWLGKALTLDFGESLITKRPVSSAIAKAFPVTLNLVLPAFVLGVVVAVVFGVVAAVNQDRWPDHVTRLLSVGALSVPDFAIGTIIILLLVTQVGWLPPLGYESVFSDPWRNVVQFFIPALIIGLRFSASGMRMTRNTMLEVLREDYVRTARAKGLDPRRVIVGHAFRNAMIPVVTLMGLQLTTLLSGSIVIERVFTLPGLGTQLIDSITRRDYPQLQAIVLFFGFILITVNIIVDSMYAVLDPRIRY